jgi:hypothetical protein
VTEGAQLGCESTIMILLRHETKLHTDQVFLTGLRSRK